MKNIHSMIFCVVAVALLWVHAYHETSFGCGDGENGRCNVGGGAEQILLIELVNDPAVGFAFPPPATIRTIPFVRCCCWFDITDAFDKPCCWCTIDVKSELIRFGELTRIRSGDKFDAEQPLLRWLAVAAAIDTAVAGSCGWGRSTVGVTAKFVIATPAGGEWALIGGELSPLANG